MKLVYCNVKLIDHEMTGNSVRRERKLRNLSTEEVASACGISLGQFARLEAGDGRWTEELFDRVSDAINDLVIKRIISKIDGDPDVENKKHSSSADL